MNENDPLNNIPPPVLNGNPKSKLVFYVVGLVCVIGISLIGFLVWNQSSNLPNPDSQSENLGSDQNLSAEQPESQILDTSAWKTYSNEELGFDMKYPSDWHVDNGQVVNITTGSTFEVTKNNNPRNLTLDEWFLGATVIGGRPTAKASAQPVLVNGIRAYQFNNTLPPPSLHFEIVAIEDSQGNIFSIYGNYNAQEDAVILDQILSTFQFMETEQESEGIILKQGDPIEVKDAAILLIPDCSTRPHTVFGPGYWLVACGSVLYKYQDGSFEQIYRFPEGQHVNVSKWNGEYFLVGGKNLFLDYPNSFLYKFNGVSATFISSSLEGSVGDMSWNGSAWLIATGLATYFDGSAVAVVWSEYPLQVRLYAYDGKVVRNITEGIEPFGFGSGVAFLESDGNNWLIGGTETQLDLLSIDPVDYRDSILIRYDGTAFVDFSKEVKKTKGKFLSGISWNGEYFVILGSNPEEKPWIGIFDDARFSALSEKVLFEHLNHLSGVVWTGDYWMIADASGTGTGAYGYNTDPLRIVAFNGKEFSRVGKVAGNVLIGGQGEIGEGIVMFGGVNSNGQGILLSVPVTNELVQ